MNVPRSVNTIGRGVFKDCESLVSIHIPDNVKSIGDLAFWHCKSLASIEIPESVTSIGMNAFSYGRLESVYIPASITAMGEAPFSTCWALKNINVASDNPHYVSIDGVLFSKDMERIIAFPAGKKVEEYRIPSSVLSIKEVRLAVAHPMKTGICILPKSISLTVWRVLVLMPLGGVGICKVLIFLQVLPPSVCRLSSLVNVCKPSISAIRISGNAR